MAPRLQRGIPAQGKGRRAKGSRSRKKLTPSRERRGLERGQVLLTPESPEVAPLTERIEALQGTVIGAYREPFSGRPVVLATLPLAAVQPTPFQRDLSPTHAKRLAENIEQTGSFLDPLIVVEGTEGRLWTPNGRHRLAAAKLLGLGQITALVCADEALAFKILALNTEKPHGLKDRSLEVIRMARELAVRHPRSRESDYTAEFESAELLTLGLVYEDNKRFAGGAYRPFLHKVDRFADRPLPAALRQREGFAARLVEIDAEVTRIVAELRGRGFRSPYLRAYVVARINPVRFHRARRGDRTPPMPVGAAFTRMAVAARKFDPESVRESDLALVAAFGAEEES